MPNAIMDFMKNTGGIIVMVVALLALMIIPQRRRDKKVKNMLESLKPGDHIRTIGGFYGKIVQVKDDVVVIEVAPDKVRLMIARNAISTVENAEVENDAVEVKK